MPALSRGSAVCLSRRSAMCKCQRMCAANPWIELLQRAQNCRRVGGPIRPICTAILPCRIRVAKHSQDWVIRPPAVLQVPCINVYFAAQHGPLPDVPAGSDVQRRYNAAASSAELVVGARRCHISIAELPFWKLRFTGSG